MATLEEMPADVRSFVKAYQWQRIDPVPWAEVKKRLSDSRVGVVVTACMVMPDQPPFDAEQPGNDPSIRIVSRHVDPHVLVNTFPGQAFDHAGLREDPNLLIPLDRLREMVWLGEIGEITTRVVSLCGHITKPKRLVGETAPEIAQIFGEDAADTVILVPA